MNTHKVVRHRWVTNTPTCAKCGKRHLGVYRDDSIGCFKCGQNDHFIRKCPKKRQSNDKEGNRAHSSSVASPDRAVSR